MFKINDYFGGKVKSIAFRTATLPATVGVMAPGEYTFDTQQKETVTVISGALTVRLPDADDWRTFGESEIFVVEAGRTFHLRVAVDTAYLCTYG